MPTNSTTPPSIAVLVGCSQCGATLPDGAQFCLKCGKPVASAAASSASPADFSETSATVLEVPPPAAGAKPKNKRRLLVSILLVLLIGVVLWAVTSDSSGAQQFQELVGLKQDRIILDSAFSVGAHTFRYYKFALPEGSMNVAVVGQFTSAADSQDASHRRNQAKDANVDSNIEVYILTDSAFTVWQNGYATGSLYESGKVIAGSVQAEVPAGAGIYYLVFSNKAAPKTAKAVHATVLLRYKSWLPESVLRWKARFVDWVGW
ncbi:MAG TPA: zinc ribbon domain-containing protein [Candidatus Sulfotelmatobacter sp.]|jgi:hypothetical protein